MGRYLVWYWKKCGWETVDWAGRTGRSGMRRSDDSGVSMVVLWLPENPPAMIFFNQGRDTLAGTDLHYSLLNLRLLETPLETNSGYATGWHQTTVCLETGANGTRTKELKENVYQRTSAAAVYQEEEVGFVGKCCGEIYILSTDITKSA